MASAFEKYLRSGRRPGTAVETKFNPWHDPDDGRFTFAGRGRYVAGNVILKVQPQTSDFRGQGGDYGGAGSSGSWDSRATRKTNERSRSRPVPKPVDSTGARQKPANPESHLVVQKNGYRYEIDAHVRTRRVSGEIRLQPETRSKRAQINAGKPDRRVTDDGGHYIGVRFNGPREWFNHFAQDANFNRGAYRALENQWASSVRSGKRVFVDIVPYYRGTSMRPYKLVVRWIVDGNENVREFGNEEQGR